MSRDDLGVLGLGRDVERKLRDAILALCERETDAFIERQNSPSVSFREAARDRGAKAAEHAYTLRWALARFVETGSLVLLEDDREALRAAKEPRRRRPTKTPARAAEPVRERPRAARAAEPAASTRALPRSVDLDGGTQLLLRAPEGPGPEDDPPLPKNLGRGLRAGAAMGMLVGGFLGAIVDAGEAQKDRGGKR